MFTSTFRTTKKLTRQKQLCDLNFVSHRCSFVDYVAHNLESFVVPLMVIRKSHNNKKTKQTKPTLVWSVGDTHFTGGRYWRGYKYHCDTGSL